MSALVAEDMNLHLQVHTNNPYIPMDFCISETPASTYNHFSDHFDEINRVTVLEIIEIVCHETSALFTYQLIGTYTQGINKISSKYAKASFHDHACGICQYVPRLSYAA